MSYDAYLHIEGVDGEATAKDHEKHIAIFSFAWGGSNPTTVGAHTTGSGGGKATVSELTISKRTDKASAAIFQKMCSGVHFPKATLVLRKSGGERVDFLKYEMEQVFITSMQWSGSEGGDDSPHETVSMSFGKIEVTYALQNADGTKGEEVPYWFDQRTTEWG